MGNSTNPGDNIISLKTAIVMTSEYRSNKDSILTPGTPAEVLPICETFGKADFDTLLNQPGIEQVRIYFGMKDGKNISLVIVGVNAAGEDMISTVNPAYTDIILENGERCPADCPPPSILNS